MLRNYAVILLAILLTACDQPAETTSTDTQPVAVPERAGFAGEWAGVQTWGMENPPPGMEGEHKDISLVIAERNGQLEGKLVPFLGGIDGAVLYDIQTEGNQLKAMARIGNQPAFADSTSTNRAEQTKALEEAGKGRPPRGWKKDLSITLDFHMQDDNELAGTADVSMNDMEWLKFNYTFNRVN